VRAVFYFKEDDDDRLWLLWSSSIRIGGDTLNPVFLRVPVHLAMKVHPAVHEDKTDATVATSSKEHVERSLLERDIQLYAMTGDLGFARLCGGTMPGPATRSSPSRRSDDGSGTPRGRSPSEPVVPPLKSPAHDGDDASQQHGSARAASTGQPAEAPAGGRIIYSPRAPFLPRARPALVIPPSDGRHPMHDLYEAAEQDATARRAAAEAARNSRSGGSGGRHVPRIAPAKRADETTLRVLKKPSQLEALKREMKTLANDVLYQMYTASLGSSVSGIGHDVFVVLPPVVHAAWNLDDIDRLAAVMRLAPAGEADGVPQYAVAGAALGRGRRTDRPVAQVECEVDRLIDDVFATSPDEIEAKYEEFLLTRTTA